MKKIILVLVILLVSSTSYAGELEERKSEIEKEITIVDQELLKNTQQKEQLVNYGNECVGRLKEVISMIEKSKPEETEK